MSHTDENRFPNSASLFLLCKDILIMKNPGQKITDQEVGALLSFDPADCTHWKYGRKNIRSIKNLNTISNGLEVDTKLLIDVVQGRITHTDAYKEFIGYGSFDCTKEQRDVLLKLANETTRKADIQALPVYPEEIISLLNNKKEDFDLNAAHNSIERFAQFNQIAQRILEKESANFTQEIVHNENEINLLTLFLLMPTYLLQLAWSKCDPAFDHLEQLSNIFWVGRSVVNMRLKDFLLNGN